MQIKSPEVIELNNASITVGEAEKDQLITDNTRLGREAKNTENQRTQEAIDANRASVAVHEAHVAELLIPVVRSVVEK